MSLGIGSITIDCVDPQRLGAFWSAVLDAPIQGSSADFVLLQHPPQGGPFVVLQRVPETRVGKNRLHIDLTGEPRTEAVTRLIALGRPRSPSTRDPVRSGPSWPTRRATSSASADSRTAPA